jgi:hypothetical protein
MTFIATVGVVYGGLSLCQMYDAFGKGANCLAHILSAARQSHKEMHLSMKPFKNGDIVYENVKLLKPSANQMSFTGLDLVFKEA